MAGGSGAELVELSGGVSVLGGVAGFSEGASAGGDCDAGGALSVVELSLPLEAASPEPMELQAPSARLRAAAAAVTVASFR